MSQELRYLALAVWVLVSTLCSARLDAEQPRNLLIVTLDTLRADHLGFMGYQRPTSPNLDRLARRATVFSDVTCSMPTTLPSHLTMFTGLTPRQHGVLRNGMVPADGLDTVFTRCRQHGRRTAAIVGAEVVGQRYVGNLGFDEVVFEPRELAREASAAQVTDRALGWIEEHGGAPFALWVHYFDPHEPYSPPPDLAAGWVAGGTAGLPAAMSGEELLALNDSAVAAGLSAAERRHVVDLYDAEIAFLDLHVGRLLEAVLGSQREGDTLVVVVGDHGQAHGERDFWGHGRRLLEPVVKVPLLVHRPGQKDGRTVTAPVESGGLFATVVEVMGLGPVPAGRLRSLAPALTGDIDPAAERVVVRRTYPEAPQRMALAILTPSAKATWYRDDGGEECWVGEVGAPDGLDARVACSSDWQRRLRRAVEQHGVAEPEDAPPIDPAEAEMLKALGYVEAHPPSGSD